MPFPFSTDKKTKKQQARLCYLEREYPRLQDANRRLQEENTTLRAMVEQHESIIEQLHLQIEELRRMIFRPKKKTPEPPPSDDDDASTPPRTNGRSSRTAASYRRPVPSEDTVTATEVHSITACPDCSTPLTRLRTIMRYVEDTLPMAEWWTALKRVTRHEIVTGYCRSCKRQRSAIPIPKHTVLLGNHIKQFVVFASTILRCSNDQIKDFLLGAMRFHVSDGELHNSMTEHARVLLPEMSALHARIDAQSGSHWDETPWRVRHAGDGGQYAWVKTGTETTDTVFALGKSRGKRVAERLRGNDPPPEQVGISDDYGGYLNLFPTGKHALCWSHPHRKFRDLKNSGVYSGVQRERCRVVYASFSALYAEVDAVTREPFRMEHRVQQHRVLQAQFDMVAAAHPDDPAAIVKIKTRLRKQKERYFVCILHEGIPPDNNKAERALRHLVIKRRMSQGSKTAQGAAVASVLYSVLLSLWWKDKQGFFPAYNRLLGGAPGLG